MWHSDAIIVVMVVFVVVIENVRRGFLIFSNGFSSENSVAMYRKNHEKDSD